MAFSSTNTAGIPPGKGKKFGIVVSKYHKEITERLLTGATELLKKHGTNAVDIFVRYAPGAFELPLMANRLFDKENVLGIICLGCVIKGETDHNHYINQAVANALLTLSMKRNKPVLFGIITPNNREEALARAGGKQGNKGEECAIALLKMTADDDENKPAIGF